MKKIWEIETILTCLRWLIRVVLGVMIVALIAFVVLACVFYFGNTQLCFIVLNNSWCLLKLAVSALFWLVTLYVACKQLKKQSDIASITALSELRKLLTSEHNKKVHVALLPEDEQVSISVKPSNEEEKKDKTIHLPESIDMPDIFNYLGTLELGVLMIKKNLLIKRHLIRNLVIVSKTFLKKKVILIKKYEPILG